MVGCKTKTLDDDHQISAHQHTDMDAGKLIVAAIDHVTMIPAGWMVAYSYNIYIYLFLYVYIDIYIVIATNRAHINMVCVSRSPTVLGLASLYLNHMHI